MRYGFEKANQIIKRTRLSGKCDTRYKGNILNFTSGSGKYEWGKSTYRCVFANEWDKFACKIYRKNFGKEEMFEGDIRELPAESFPDHEILTAGFPCQSFSIAGKRRGFNDTRGTMFFEICRIAAVKKPNLLFLENVKGLLNHDGGETFRIILDSLSELGYDCEWEVLNSKNFGVPQNRERIFIIGYLRRECRRKVFPIGEGSKEVNELRKQRVVSNTIKPDFAGVSACTYIEYQKFPQKRSGEIIRSVNAVNKDNPMYGRYNLTPDISSCLNSVDAMGVQIGRRIRRLTPVECERLQGFPDNWTEGISDSQRYKCLGNAVTTNVITEIALNIMKEEI